MSLWKITNRNMWEELIVCSHQCAVDYMYAHNLLLDDLHELDPYDKNDAEFLEENIPSSCNQCRRHIEGLS